MANDSGYTFTNNTDDFSDMLKLVGSEIQWFPGLFTKLVFLTCLSVFTTAANLFMIYIACNTKSLVSNTKVFFISLCLAHLLGSLVVIPLWIVTRLSQDTAILSPHFCQIASFVWVLMILSSFYSLSAISLDRFFIISNPMRYPIKATTPKKLFATICVWVFSCIFSSAPMMGWGEYKFQADAIPICGLNMKHSPSFTAVLMLLGFGMPLTIDIFCCARIISIARRQSRSIDSRKGSSTSVDSIGSAMSASSTRSIQPVAKLSKLKQKLNSLRLVFAGTGSFLVCWLPYFCAHIWMTSVQSWSHDAKSMPYILEFVVMCVALLNGLINPTVIMCSNRDYRKRIKLVLYQKFGLFKDDIMEDRSDIDSSIVNTRRIQHRHFNLNEIFQNITHLKSDGFTQDSDSCKQHTVEVVEIYPETFTKTEKLDNTLLVIAQRHECKRLMSQGSICSLDLDSQTDNVTGDITQFSRSRNASVETTIDETCEQTEISGIVIK